MSIYKGSHDITYNSISTSILPIGSKISASNYVVNGDNEIVFHLPIINAFDIDWNHAYLTSLDTYIDSTEDLLHQLEVIYNSIGNIDLSNYVTKDELLSKDYLTQEIANIIYAPKSVEDSISQIYTYLDNKANVDSIPKSIYDLTGYSDFATQAWVSNQLRYYAKSPYDVYVDNGGTLSQTQWLESLKGKDGVNGASAYQIYLQHGGSLSETNWLNSLKGADGWSAYQIAKANDPSIGTQEEWIASLKGDKGDKGDNGKSAYQLAVDAGYTGTQEEWITSLKGEKGERGDKGETGASINILGYYETLEELKEATADTINSIGDAYNVGGVFYTYNDQFTSIDDKWKYAGSIQGNDGKSAYDLAVLHGYTGTESEWIKSLKGEKGEKGDTGEKGEKGDKGDIGRSAYDVAQSNGFEGTETEWLASLKGDKGDQGIQGPTGNTGASAYQIAVEAGYTGTLSEWLESLKGVQGPQGLQGNSAFDIYRLNGGTLTTESEWIASLKGTNGKSAYEVAQSNGFTGTETEWLASLKGDKGDQGIQGPTGNTGLNAYQIAVEAGYTGTETEWLESLKGAQGPQGKSAYDIYKEYQIATGNTYLNESDWNNKLANIQVYSAGSGINISEEGVISSTIDISGNAIWYEETE